MAREHSSPDPKSEDDYDTQEHKGCYIFTPADADASSTTRPPKRRRTSKPTPTTTDQCLFPPLMNGTEHPDAVQLRWNTYNRLWAAQEARIKAILNSFNQKTLDDVSKFVTHAEPSDYDGKIPTALVLTGPNIASHAPLFAQFAERIRDVDAAGPVVVLTSKDAANLKGTLKKLIKDATEGAEGVDEDEEIVGRRGARLLNYDLQILQNWCALNPRKKVVVAVQDTEAFDGAIMADLVSLFSSYLDRIPFVLLLGIATSLEIFHEKLPKATVRMMQGEKFDVERADECLAQVFNDAVLGEETPLRLGASVCELMIERQKNHTQSIQTFVAALKYAYMSHFYANPLSIILKSLENNWEGLTEILHHNHIQAIRNLPSFRRMIEDMVENRETKEVRKLLEDEAYLRNYIPKAAAECHSYAVTLGNSLKILEISRNCLSSSTPRAPRYELLPRALRGDLHVDTPMVRELLLLLKKMNSTSLLLLLNSLADTALAPALAPFQSELETLASEAPGTLTSEFDVISSTLRSTAVSKKIQLNAHKSGLTKNDAEYSRLVQKVHEVFHAYFDAALRPVEDIFLHEMFFYDLISPHRDVFAPRARATVERALCRPVDYLGCECCELNEDEVAAGEDGTMKRSHPPTSIVYQLYLEGGTLINGFDLWNAFRSVVMGEDVVDEGEKEEGEEERVGEDTAQALFYRSVAELKVLGFVKPTRKRVDHLQKLAWKGL